MARVQITADNELTIRLAPGQSFSIHPIWLRERCRDAATIDLQTGQRWQDPSDLDPNLRLMAVREPEPGRLRISFSDGHEADFLERDILEEAVLAPGDADCPAPQLWDARLTALPRFTWTAAPSDAQRLEWLSRFLELGFIIMSAVPRQPGTVLQVAASFGFTRETNFGALFDVRSKADANDLAYTPIPLDPHTDNPYRSPVPGVQLLHCLVNQTSGGLSTLVDGFCAATVLRQQDPEAFALLTQTSVRFRFRDAHTEMVASSPLLEADATATLRAINFSPRLDYVPLRPAPELTRFYAARRALDRLLRSPDFEIRFLLNAGDLVMMDNRRLLHGRTGFDPSEGLRHLQGCYIDIDAPRSHYRVLRRRLAATGGRA